ncbi:hypothetical protein MKX01_026493, partial [Papaver californicum]
MEIPGEEGVVCDEFITLEILSRLPVKSLMRFKCVCKRWKSIIHKDQFFIDLHLSRSITTTPTRRTSFLLVGKPATHRRSSGRMYLLSAEFLPPSNEEEGYLEVGTTFLWEPPFLENYLAYATCSLNGLICFMDTLYCRACLYNSSTRESTPWIKSIIKQEEADP